jgi:hypothetical protein
MVALSPDVSIQRTDYENPGCRTVVGGRSLPVGRSGHQAVEDEVGDGVGEAR